VVAVTVVVVVVIVVVVVVIVVVVIVVVIVVVVGESKENCHDFTIQQFFVLSESVGLRTNL
jgi:hypothetical protein